MSTENAPTTAVGLAPGTRFKCEGCGNLTRFDVVVSERTSRFWHVAVSGVGTVEEADVQEQTIESVTCRWCGSSERIVTEDAPSAGGNDAPSAGGNDAPVGDGVEGTAT